MTAPHIGNTGVNDEDPESRADLGRRLRRARPRPASRRTGARSARLDDELREQGVVGISGIDTRALTRHLRERGAMRVGISIVETDAATALLERVLASPSMAGADLTGEVTTAEPYVVPAVGERRFTVAALDLGIKAMTPRRMAERGIEVHVLPVDRRRSTTCSRVGADGVFFSNGPGDPATADHAGRADARACSTRGVPVFGICFGNQILGRALGFGTYKLKYGHRGINQPVQDRATGKVEVTAHNHGFAVDAPLDGVDRHPVRPGRGQPRLPQRRRRRGPALPRRARRSRCSTTRRRRPARTTRLPVRPVRRPDGRTRRRVR